MANFIIEFDDLLLNLERAGGKGLSLARLIRNRVPVPDGLVISTEAYNRFVEDNNILSRILALYEELDMDDIEQQKKAADAITLFFQEGELLEDIKYELITAYESLKVTSLAVRSSATAEDLPQASFAGLQETYLNVSGVPQFLEAVVNTWASLWTQRAIAYRARHSIEPQTVSMAVVVQEMVAATSAGVLFTMNPINGERNEMLITSSWGLGEAIVSGSITPDSIVVEKEGRKIQQQKIVDKPTRIVANPLGQGTLEEQMPSQLRKAPSLTPGQIDSLVGWGLIIERFYGAPVDIEWVLRKTIADNDKVHETHHIEIVQARPITNLPSIAPRWKPPHPDLILIRSSLAEQIPNPVTPLFGSLGLRMVNLPTADLGRLALGKAGERYQYLAINGYVYLSTPVTVLSAPSIIKASLGPMLKAFRHSHETWVTALGEFKQFVHLYEGKDVHELTNIELLDCARNLIWASGKYYTTLQGSTIPNGMVSEKLFTLLYKLVKEKDDPPAQALLYGLKTNALRSEEFLYDLAMRIRLRPELAEYLKKTPSGTISHAIFSGDCPVPMDEGDCRPEWFTFVHGIEEYFDEFGYTSYDFDFSHPTPSEVPWITIDLLKSYLNGTARSPYQWQNTCDEQREKTISAIEKDIKKLPISWFERSFNWAKRSSVEREDSLSALFLAFPIIRLHLAELGRRLVTEGILNQVEDIYWLLEEELIDLIEKMEENELHPSFQKIVDLRQEEWISSLRLSPPMMFPEIKWMAKMVPWIENAKHHESKVIKGTATSAGSYTGVARVVFTPAEFPLLKQGEILVAVTTTPAWTPLFNRCAAIVTDIGGPLSHSSIIAREYGLPAVVATGNATRRILSGMVITVDGNTGQIHLP